MPSGWMQSAPAWRVAIDAQKETASNATSEEADEADVVPSLPDPMPDPSVFNTTSKPYLAWRERRKYEFERKKRFRSLNGVSMFDGNAKPRVELETTDEPEVNASTVFEPGKPPKQDPVTECSPVCCRAGTARCLACAACMSIADYCEKYSKTPGCKPPAKSSTADAMQ